MWSDTLILIFIGVFSLFCILFLINMIQTHGCKKKLAVFSEIVIQMKCEFSKVREKMVPFLADMARIDTNLEILTTRIAGMTGTRGIRAMTALIEETLVDTFALIRKNEPVLSAFGVAEGMLLQEARLVRRDDQPDRIVATTEKTAQKPRE